MKKIYFPNLNGLRFIAALIVMIYHFFGIEVINGHYGVVLFFALSGFLITYLLLEEKESTSKVSILKFYMRRVLRIWPLYFLILFGTCFYILIFNNEDIVFLKNMYYYLFFGSNIAFALSATIPYAGILWSVGSEEQFYLFWPWIIKKFNRKVVLYFMIFFILFFTLIPHLLDYFYFNIHSSILIQKSADVIGILGFNAMLTGSLSAFIAKTYPKNLKFIYNKIFQLILYLFIIITLLINFFPHYGYTDEIYAILFSIVILNLALNPNSLISLENKSFNYLGKISYGLYVFHPIAFTIIHYFFRDFNLSPKSTILFMLGFMLTILFSYFSFRFIESPFLKIKSNKFTIVHSNHKK